MPESAPTKEKKPMPKAAIIGIIVAAIIVVAAAIFILLGGNNDNPSGSSSSDASDGSVADNTTLSTTELTLNERNISGSFSYATEEFNFTNDIIVTNNSPWVVSIDSYGMQTVATKTVPLNVGNNTFYIHVTNPDQTVSTYTVNIYRNRLYTVRFNANGGTSVTIPDSVTEVGNYAFLYCSSLTSINYNGTKAQWNAISKGSPWNSYTGNYTIYCTDGNISK